MLRFAFAWILCCLVFTAGCGGSGSVPTGNTTPLAPQYPSIAGNWSLTAASQVFVQNTLIGGYISNAGGSVSGTLHLLNSPCYSLTTDVPVSGTITTAGIFSVTSSQVAGQTISVSGVISGGTLSSGSYAITGGCANGDKGTVAGYIVPPFTNSYSGTFVSDSTSIGVTVTTTQSGPTSDGTYQVSGSATFSGSPCFSSGTITASAIAGGYIDVTITASNGGVIEFIGEITDSTGKTIVGSYDVTAGLCVGNSGTGSLSD